MINLGLEARDKITSYRGIVTARAQYLTGCDQYQLTLPAEPGKGIESAWFDEGRLEIIGEGINPERVAGEVPGGPQSTPPSKH